MHGIILSRSLTLRMHLGNPRPELCLVRPLTQLAAVAAVHCIPEECLERIVEERKVYGLLISSERYTSAMGMGGQYEGFYSTRQHAEKRMRFLYPFLEEQFGPDESGTHQERIKVWCTRSTEEMLTKSLSTITEHYLSPLAGCEQIHVYFTEGGYVTNVLRRIPTDVFHAEFSVDYGVGKQCQEPEEDTPLALGTSLQRDLTETVSEFVIGYFNGEYDDETDESEVDEQHLKLLEEMYQIQFTEDN